MRLVVSRGSRTVNSILPFYECSLRRWLVLGYSIVDLN